MLLERLPPARHVIESSSCACVQMSRVALEELTHQDDETKAAFLNRYKAAQAKLLSGDDAAMRQLVAAAFAEI